MRSTERARSSVSEQQDDVEGAEPQDAVMSIGGVDWRRDLGGGYRAALIQAGAFRSDAGALFGPVPRLLWNRLVDEEIDAEHRLLQALNCLLIETPAGRVLVETGIGERVSDKVREMRRYEGSPIASALATAGFEPGSVDVVAMSHLHFDHAGGLLLADGNRAFPRAAIVAQRAEWEIALSGNSRIVASYDQPELRLVREWGEDGWVDGEREVLPGVFATPTGGHSAGHQAIVVRPPGARPLAFFGDLCMRPWSANPRWVTAFDDFPLDSVAVKGELFRKAAEEAWTVVLSHEARQPIGRLVPDRDRYRFEPD
jgi:glyoxylase-like metal-dependent hydrolase (beta-lactamase superfamily II)